MIIKKLILRNFKKMLSQEFEFTDFDLLVGTNNSGKSTVLQALAIWQFCVDEFHRSKRTGNTGIQIVLPNFTALPLPEFNLLWFDKTDRKYPQKKQEYIYIEITLQWRKPNGEEGEFGIKMRYQTPQSLYAIPQKGWKYFKNLDKNNELPRIVYVPPFSGLEPNEIWFDDGIVRKNVGKAQPGSVLRNLLFRVIDKTYKNEKGESVSLPIEKNDQWIELQKIVKEWFGVTINTPLYEKKISTEIKVSYTNAAGKEFDIISGGSGFHQALTLFAFYYGYPDITTLMFDEPDAHLHVNLQRNVLSYLRKQRSVQLIIATHSEEFIKGVEASSIISILSDHPKRIQTTANVIRALSDIDNLTITKALALDSPLILYVEGEDDERILRAWANTLRENTLFSKFCVEKMRGGSKDAMKTYADSHFAGLREIVPQVKRLMIFDFDSEETSYHPDAGNPVLFEWRRKNIENYLLVPEAWKRAVLDSLNQSNPDLFTRPIDDLIETFFLEQNLTLPPNASWEDLKANIFMEVNGKKILFENSDSLFQKISSNFKLKINRENVANIMNENEIHADVKDLFLKIHGITT